MGDGEKASLRLQFNPKVRLAFHGATITTDAGLLAFREFDDALGLTEIAEDYLQESRTGRNILHHLVPLLRQSIYSRLVLLCYMRFKDRLLVRMAASMTWMKNSSCMDLLRAAKLWRPLGGKTRHRGGRWKLPGAIGGVGLGRQAMVAANTEEGNEPS